MEVVYWGSLVGTFLGVFFGVLLGYIAVEELKTIKRWLVLITRVLFTTLIILTLSYSKNVFIISLLLFFLVVFFYAKNKPLNSLILGILFYLGYLSQQYFTLTASLIFLYFLPAGSLLKYNSKKKSRIYILYPTFINYGLFVLTASILYIK